jgi:hypothetical protein
MKEKDPKVIELRIERQKLKEKEKLKKFDYS